MKNIKNYKKLRYAFSVIFICLFMFLTVNVSAVESNTESKGESVDSMVKNITVQGGTFTSQFKEGRYMYSVYLETFKENLSVSVQLNDPRFEYTINGDKLLDRTEDNVVIINVTDPDDEYSDEKYILNIFFEATGFTYLDAENGIFSPQFDKFHTTYYIILENNIDTFEKAGINWKTVNKDAVVELTCLDELNEDGTLPEGERTDYKLEVCEADGTSKSYKLRLYRKSSMIMSIDENALLASIKINGGAVDTSKFKQKQSFYDIIVPNSITELNIQAYPVDRSNVTEIIGSTVMKENEPIYITIVVTSDKYNTSSYYTLRCQYDTMMYTEKYTYLQLIAYVGFGVFIGLIIGFGLSIIFRRRKRAEISSDYIYKKSEGNELTVEQSETSTEE